MNVHYIRFCLKVPDKYLVRFVFVGIYCRLSFTTSHLSSDIQRLLPKVFVHFPYLITRWIRKDKLNSFPVKCFTKLTKSLLFFYLKWRFPVACKLAFPTRVIRWIEIYKVILGKRRKVKLPKVFARQNDVVFVEILGQAQNIRFWIDIGLILFLRNVVDTRPTLSVKTVKRPFI